MPRPDFDLKIKFKKLPRKDMSMKRPGASTRSRSTPKSERLNEIIRVDHAGEYGAVRIYKGQLAVLEARAKIRRGEDEALRTVRHMEEQEQEHLATFNKLMNERGVRPTAMTPIWHVAGYALGATTALLGQKAAMACTAAVEEVIEEHYQDQLNDLGDDESDLKATITQFREEEIAHKDTALEYGAEETPGYKVLSSAIKASTRFAIRVSEKI
jgi:3-demethoxyubiquinol 3-hydroxylase